MGFCVHSDVDMVGPCALCGVDRRRASEGGVGPSNGQTPLESVRVPKPRVEKPKAAVSALDILVAEYATGIRCLRCHTLKVRGQCAHQREELRAEHMAEIEDFLEGIGDPDDRKLRWVEGTAASALRREILRAGERNSPTDLPGIGVHQVAMSSLRRENGRALEWKANARPSGDELPI